MELLITLLILSFMFIILFLMVRAEWTYKGQMFYLDILSLYADDNDISYIGFIHEHLYNYNKSFSLFWIWNHKAFMNKETYEMVRYLLPED